MIWDSSLESGGDITLSTISKVGRYVATCNPSKGRCYQFFAKDIIFAKLEFIQVTTTLTDPLYNIWEDYRVQRSDKCFFMTICTIMGAKSSD